MPEVTDRIDKAPPRRFRRYPEYRDSGVGWLGEIPAHWNVRRLKTIASVQLSNVDKKSEAGQVPVKLCNYVDVYYNDRITAELEFMNATATPEQVRRFLLGVGDVVITKDSESWNDIAVPAVVAEDLTDVLCGYHLAQIKPRRGLDGRFLARQFSAIGMQDQFHIAANGITRFGLGGDAIRTGLFPIAPINEQRAIADFLDRETAKIDGLVANKERLIELLQEKRTALITRAVTRGLDSSVPIKDSGVEWLGEIPAHWNVRRLKTIASVQLSNVDKKSEAGQVPVKLCNYVDVYYNDRITAELEFMNATATPEQVRRFLLGVGDVVITKDSESWNDIAVPAVVAEDLTDVLCGYHLAQIKPRRGLDGRFLARQFSAIGMQDQFHIAANGITRFGLGGDAIRTGLFPIAPINEQRAIADFLDRETAKIDALTGKIRQAIEHLKEFRTALISAAVTGKIDVRGQAA